MAGERERIRPSASEADLGLAVLVAEAAEGGYEPIAVVGSLREAHEVCRADMASRMARVEHGESPLCPERYTLWARHADGHYQHYSTMEALAGDEPPRTPQKCPPLTLVLTREGFLNLEQACEFRLRYADLSHSDAISGIDVLLSNGSAQLLEPNDPGFDQLVDLIEEHGYVISVATKDTGGEGR